MAQEKPKMSREESELLEYRNLVTPPETFEEGFNWKSVLGAFFIGFVMMPASIYLGLVAGTTMGPAAEWVTIILFTEAAKRSFVTLRRQEIYILYYIAGGLTSMMGGAALSGGAFARLIWNQYLVQSPAAASFAADIPEWVSPPAGSAAIAMRTFFHRDWLPAILIVVLGEILSRVSWFTFGYFLFRVTSDVERLSFPMAPIAAQGATALAESSAKTETWRWRVFSIGTMIGIVFGAVYVALPTVSGLVLIRPIRILPIPWIDFTQSTEKFLPATPTGITTNIGAIFNGFVLPFWVVIGTSIATLGSMAINPALHRFGLLKTWEPGMDTIHTTFANSLDFWISFSIGSSFAVAFIGIYKVIAGIRQRRGEMAAVPPGVRSGLPQGRGDFNMWAALACFVAITVFYIWLCNGLINLGWLSHKTPLPPEKRFPLAFLVFFGLLWTPFTSYVNARMIGLTGQYVPFPFVVEATFILSGYKGVDIWFAPIPYGNYGFYAQKFREVELTGTKFTSILKAEGLMLALMLFCSLLFWSYIWQLNPIPHVSYPYAQQMWEFNAMNQAFWITATSEHNETFLQTIKPVVIGAGLVFGVGSYGLLSLIGWPVMLIYGFIRGMGQIPHFLVPEIVGALLGRYYFGKLFGREQWMRYTPVLAAGFACGMGLISMVSIAAALIFQSISKLPF